MTKKKEDLAYDPGVKTGVRCTVIKVQIKEGKKSGIPLGTRIMTIGGKPTVGSPLYGAYEGEHVSGDPKTVKYPASSTILKIHKVNNVGLCVETQTSVLLITKTLFV